MIGVNLGTLQTRYPRVQALRRDKGQVVHPRAATCPAAPDIGIQICYASVAHPKSNGQVERANA
jgi:hypothetical protein